MEIEKVGNSIKPIQLLHINKTELNLNRISLLPRYYEH